jgi:hypothetical protein
MRRTESAYTPERRETDRTPGVPEEAAEGGEAGTRPTVPRDVSAVKYSPESAITI